MFSHDFLEDIRKWENDRQLNGKQVKTILSLLDLQPGRLDFDQNGNVENQHDVAGNGHYLFCNGTKFLSPKYDDNGQLLRLTTCQSYIFPFPGRRIWFEVERSGRSLMVEPAGAEDQEMNDIWFFLERLSQEWPSTKEAIDTLWDEIFEKEPFTADPELEKIREAKRLRVWPSTLDRWDKIIPIFDLPTSVIADRLKKSEDVIKRDKKLIKQKKYKGAVTREVSPKDYP